MVAAPPDEEDSRHLEGHCCKNPEPSADSESEVNPACGSIKSGIILLWRSVNGIERLIINCSNQELAGSKGRRFYFSCSVVFLVLVSVWISPGGRNSHLSPVVFQEIETKTTQIILPRKSLTLTCGGSEKWNISFQFTSAIFFEYVPRMTLSIRAVETFVYILQNKFLILCYTFFSITYTNGLPMLDYSAQGLERFGRQVKNSKTIDIPLYGSPNQGYCAMIAIGLDQVQKARL